MCITKCLSKNKTFELQVEGKKYARNIFELDFRWTINEDHAGLAFGVNIYKLFWFHVSICDNRHWNYEKNRWNLEGEYEESN